MRMSEEALFVQRPTMQCIHVCIKTQTH